MMLTLLILLTLSVSGTLAYWEPAVEGDVETVSFDIKFGQWDFTEIKENDGYVDFLEDVTVIMEDYSKKTLIKGQSPDIFDVIVVYYQPTGLFYKLDLTKNRAACQPYNSQTGCMLPDIQDPYNNPYEHIQLEFMNNIKYPKGSEVLFNGEYYYKYDDNQGSPASYSESNHYNIWIRVTDPYDQKTVYNKDQRVVIDGQLFKAKREGQLSHPHDYNGDWNLLSVSYVSSNTYQKHDVVLYGGKYYYALMNNITNISPDHSKYWKLAG